VGDEDDRLPPIPEVVEDVEAFLLERRVADGKQRTCIPDE
jgi:hypothetical protein